MEKIKINSLDIEMIAQYIAGCLSEETRDIFDELYNKFEIDEENFTNLIEELFKLMTIGYSSLSQEVYIGFGLDGLWLAKKPIMSKFIGVLLAFMLNDEPLKKEQNGFIRVITNSKGKPEYQLAITHPDRTININSIDEKSYFIYQKWSGYPKNTLEELLQAEYLPFNNQTVKESDFKALEAKFEEAMSKYKGRAVKPIYKLYKESDSDNYHMYVCNCVQFELIEIKGSIKK